MSTQALTKAIRSVVDAGTAGMPEILAKRIRLNNMLSMMTALVISPYILLFEYYGATFYALLVLPIIGLFVLVPVINSFGYHRTARMLNITVSTLAVVTYALAFDRKSGLFLFFLPICPVPLLLFGLKDRISVLYGIALPAILLQAFNLWQGSDLMLPQIVLTETATLIIRGVTLFSVGTISVFQVAFLSRAYEQSEERLRQSIVEIRDAQSKLIQSSKMSSLGEMASGIAHEINNPLSIISVQVDQLATSAEEGKTSKEEILAAVAKVQSTSLRIGKIIRGLKTFSRNAEDDPFVECDLRSITEDVLEVCHERFRSKRILLHVFLNSSLKIECRPAQISQVLLNLMNNAHDAVEKLPERWVRVAAYEKGEFVEIEVTDSGKGIPPAVASRLMEPFFTTKEVGKGTGLGLSISRGIVQVHQGTIVLDTESPNTRFVILLPKVIAKRKAA